MPKASVPPLTQRILSRLETSEWREPDPWLRDDCRIAWITTLLAARGSSCPHVSASYAVLGLHPEKVWPAILARRKALLGSEVWAEFSSLDLPPKKPAASVPLLSVRGKAGGGAGSSPPFYFCR